MFYPFHSNQPVSQLLQFKRFTFHSNCFQAHVVIKVHMLDRKDQVMILMLRFCRPAGKILFVVVIYQHNRPGNFPVILPFLFTMLPGTAWEQSWQMKENLQR